MIGLFQNLYIEKMLKGISMLNSKRVQLHVRVGVHFSREMSPNTPEERDCISKVPYASAVGSLMYAMICTRLNIYYAIGIMSRYQYNLV